MRAIAVAVVLAAAPAAVAEGRFTVWGGGGVWNDADRPGHAALLLAYDREAAGGDGRLGLELNTDTLRANYAVRLGERVEAGVGLAGEALLAGLLDDYWQDGRVIEERAFFASYVAAHAGVKIRIEDRTYFEVLATGRRWIFGESDTTAAAFELPPDTWVFEPRVRYTWWGLGDDAGWRDRHRPFPRLRGLAASVEIGTDVRADDRAWGARDPDAFERPDPRNDPGRLIFRVRQQIRAGWQVHPAVRTQLVEHAAFGVGEDDLTRDRIGGLNPYSVPLAGAPWAAFLSERHVAGLWSGHVRLLGDLEVGPLATAVVLQDPERTGANDAGVHWGVGGLADWRAGPWQVDLRGGWSPSVAERSGRAAWNVWASVGWASR